MNKLLKQTGKLRKPALMAIITFVLCTGTALAVDSTINKVTCQREGDAFYSSMISFTEFTETWKDIFYRYPQNTCYYTDIENIAKQLETQRQNLRKAFYSCGTNIENLKKSYFELEAEIMYLRNFISISQAGIKPVSDEKIMEKLTSYFVDDKNIYTTFETKDLFDKFKQKYKTKITGTYKDCKDAGIQALIKKWDQLVKTIKSFGSNLEKLSEEFNTAINTPVERTGSFINSFTTIRLNQLLAKLTPGQIIIQITKDNGGSAPTLESVQQGVQSNEETYAQKITETSIAATYDALYKNGGDSMALDFVAKLKDLNTIVKDTFKPIESITDCTKKTSERQCK